MQSRHDPDKGGTLRRTPFTCTMDCGGRCELVACVRDGQVVRVDTPPGRPDTATMPRLVPCIRGRSRHRLLDPRQRVMTPLRRTGPRESGQFEEIGWDEALDAVAARLTDVRERFGTAAVLHAFGYGSLGGRGFSGNAASRRFFSHWGSVTETVGNPSSHCAGVAARWMLGTGPPNIHSSLLLNSRLIILWAMNPAETRMGPNLSYLIALARDNGARVWLIDPRYTDSGVLADEWMPLRPGTDAALVAAMAYLWETQGLVDHEHMASQAVGYDAYRRYLRGDNDGVPKTPAWAAEITRVPEERIRQLASEYATTQPAVILSGLGPQRALFGEQISRALLTLACMSGNLGIPGGGIAYGEASPGQITLPGLPFGPHPPARRISCNTWASEILGDALDPPLKMAYIVAGNIINRSPDTSANARALQQLDFVVVHEPFHTPTTRYADIVLPICTDLERSDLVVQGGRVFLCEEAVPPRGQARTDYWVLSRLAERVGLGPQYTQQRTQREWLDLILRQSDLPVDDLREGAVRREGSPSVPFADFREDPTAHPLQTESGRIQILYPRAEAYGLPAIPAYVSVDDGARTGHPLQLVTPHSKLRANSGDFANPWLQRLEPQVVWISSRDAASREIHQGDLVAVHNQRGAVLLPAKVTERIMPGVVCIYQGSWYRPGEDGADRGGCANVLTERRESPTGGLATHSAWVEVTRREP
jgi:anaerobic dimethyl sulfoxide reductase subunit A